MKLLWKNKAVAAILSLGVTLTSMSALTIPIFGDSIPDDEIIILYTNDVHGGVDDNIGYAGLALYEKQMRKETPYITLVDAGDSIQGAPIGTISEGKYIVDIMDKVGYDFAIPGNHEFDYGMDRFLELSKELDCGYYSCNFIDLRTQKTVFEPYKMQQYGDTKIAFVGISTPESFTKSTPAYFQNEVGEYIYGFCEDDTGESLNNQVQKTVDKARDNGADYVILVGHLGLNGTTPRWSTGSLIAGTSGIDAFIDGHSHETFDQKLIKNKSGTNVIATQTGTKLNNIGKLTIDTNGKISTELVSKVPLVDTNRIYTVQPGDTLKRIADRNLGSYSLWNEIYKLNVSILPRSGSLTSGMKLKLPGSLRLSGEGENQKAVDATTNDFIKDIQMQFEASLETVLGYTDYTLAMNVPGTQDRLVRKQETNLGDFAADAYRYVMGSDIGFANGGGLRSDINAGEITYGDLLTMFPYGNMACVVEATGQQIKDALEMGVMIYPEESGAFQHVSGITFDVNTSIPSSVEVDDQRSFVKVAGRYRVENILVGGEPIDPNKSYTLASHAYLLKNGGDGMNMFQNCNVIKDEVMVDVDVLSSYLQDYLDGTVGENYSDYTGSGRIIIR